MTVEVWMVFWGTNLIADTIIMLHEFRPSRTVVRAYRFRDWVSIPSVAPKIIGWIQIKTTKCSKWFEVVIVEKSKIPVCINKAF